MRGESLAEALRRSKREPEAFRLFYEDQVKPLLTYMTRSVYDADTALDLTAESFAQAFTHRRRFRGSTDAEAAGWLYGIARRQLALYFRQGAVERRALRRLALEAPRLDDEEQARLFELAELGDLRAVVRAQLGALSAAQREVLELRIVDQLPYAEVASRLEISEQAARARVARGLKGLAQMLDQSPKLKEALL